MNLVEQNKNKYNSLPITLILSDNDDSFKPS